MKCPKCGRDNLPQSVYCIDCGTRITAQSNKKSSPSPGQSEPDATGFGTSDQNTQKAKRSLFRRTLLLTAIPLTSIALVSTSLAVPNEDYSLGIWWIDVGLLLLGILVGFVMLIARRRDIAGGLFAGIGIGAVALGGTCFANLSLYQNIW